MELSEIEEHIFNLNKDVNIEKFLLKHPIDVIVQFDETNYKEKLSDNSKHFFNFKKLKKLSEFKYEKIKSILNKCKSEQFEFYKYEFEKELTDDEITDLYFARDEKILNIENELSQEQLKIDFFQICIETFLNQSERLKDYIKIIEIEKQI
jgi:hypothetical protein